MDPNAAYREMIDSMRDQDTDGTRLAFYALAGWVARGGFLPMVPADEFHRTMAAARRFVRAGRDAQVAAGA
jgi:hypothetical protein